MRIHEIIVIPAAGHAGAGVYSRGHTVDAFAEVDLVDHYVRRLVDELEQSSVRYRVVQTRRAPGTTLGERTDLQGVCGLPVTCSVGWDSSKNQSGSANVSVVRYGPEVPLGLACELTDVVAHWGSLYVYGHRRSNPVVEKDLKGVVIEPFRLNGPNAAQYAQRMDTLGRDVGRFLADYCLAKNTGTTMKAPSMLRRPF